MRSRKRFLSLLMALFMLLSLFPASALAEEPEGGEGSIQPAEDGGVIAPVTDEDPEAPVPGEAADPDALPPPGDELQSVDFGLSGGTLWNLYEDGTLEIKNSVLHNPMADYENPGDAPWYQYRDQIYTVRVGSQVSRIGNYAFYGLTKAWNFLISSDVKEIGDHAFEGCVRLGDQPGCYGNVIGILPGSVEKIGAYAFKDCTGITSIYPLFNSTSNLKSVDVGAFSGCTGLTQAIFPGEVKSIPAHCFEYCTGLQSFVTTGGMTGIGSNAFEGCTGLQYAALGSGVQYVWGGAFSGCTSLAEVNLPTSLIIVGADAFSGCDLLTTVYFDGKLSAWPRVEECISTIGNDALLYAELVLMEDDPDHMCGDDLQWCVYGDIMFIAGSGAMDDYSSGSATPWASYRSQIKTVKICTGVTTVGSSAFSGCGSLKTLYLPATITVIQPFASYGCSSLADVYYHGTKTAFLAIDIESNNMAIENAAKHYLALDTGICGIGVVWTYDGTSLTITGNGSMYDWDDTANVPWRAYVDEIPRVQIGVGVTKVGKNAFNGCTALTEVSLYNSLRVIGENAFRGCTKLENIELPDSVNSIGAAAFRGCTRLSGFEFPASTTAIPDECCYGCTSLHAPGIHDSISSIGVSAFEGCTTMGLVSGSGVLTIGDRAFYGCRGVTDAYFEACTAVGEDAFLACILLRDVAMPALETVGESAFQNCKALQSVSLPAAITVGPYAFHSCSQLSSVSIPAAESIGNYAFVNCTALHGISLPGTLRSIGRQAFDGSGLNGNLTIPDGMKTIGSYALAGTGITAVTIPTSVKTIEKGAFYECSSLADVNYGGAEAMWNKISINWTDNDPLRNAALHLAPNNGEINENISWSLSSDGVLTISGTGSMGEPFASAEDQPWYSSAASIHTVRVLSSVTTVAKYCFQGLNKATTVELADSITAIYDYAFRDCWSVNELELPDHLNSIGYAAFFNCSGLRELVLPDSVTFINVYAFAYCSKLRTVHYSAGMTTVPARVFQNCAALEEIDIPEGVILIGLSAFQDCSSLAVVRLPHSLVPEGNQYNPNTIGKDAFNGCTALTDVYYNGTMAEWKTLTIHETGNDPLHAALLHMLPETGSFGGGLTWAYDDGILTISGSGPMPDFEAAEDQPWFDYQQMITGVRVLDGVTAVGGSAFFGLERARTAELADSITYIGASAFKNCTGLETLNFPAGLQIIQVRAFESVGLPGQDLVLPEGLIAVYDYAFTQAGMDSVQFPNSVRILGQSVFRDCPHLMGLTFPASVSVVPQYFCSNCPEFSMLSFPEGVTTIGERAFWKCAALDWVQFPATLQTIEDYAFYQVGTVDMIEYAATEEEWAQVHIGSYNSSIETPTKFLMVRGLLYGDIYWWVNSQGGLHVRGPGRMPDFASQGTPPWYAYRDSINGIWVEGKLNDPAGGITYISDYAFAGLEHVDYVSINNCCTGIGDHAFEGLSALPYLYLPEQLESIGDYAFRGCSGMNYLEFTDALADIGAHAFEGCSSLPDLILPASLSFGGIGNFAFANCTGLTSIILQGGDSIPEGAFYYCSGLRSLTIPVSVTDVGYAAFSSCDALSDVWYDGILPQWNAIQIAGQNDPLLNADLHCAPSYGMLENGLQWSFSNGVLTVSGEGPMPDFEHNWDTPWFSFKEYITGVEILEGVTSVGDNAFVAFTKLTELTLPDGLTEIGYQAFRGCTALASVNLPASLATVDTGAFYGCTALADVYFRGTPLQWADMSVAGYNEPLLAAALHYTLEGIPIDDLHFPDANFRAYVAKDLDPTGDLWLTPQEIAAVEEISCAERGIASLQGIACFSKLDYLDCSYNQLSNLDLSGNALLTELDCSCNETLTALNLSALPDFELLTCSGCILLKQLDLRNNPELTELDCRECALTALDLRSNGKLWYLDCSGNALTALDLSALPALGYLMCNDNQLTELSLDHPALQYIDCYRNALTALDLSACSALTYVDCSDNGLETLTLGEQPLLKELYCHENSLTRLDLTGCPLVQDAVLTTEGELNEGTMIYSKGQVEFYVDPGVVLVTDHEGIPIDEAHFPDAIFRAWVSQNTIDFDGNGWLTDGERMAVKQIEVISKAIASLKGIEYFYALEYLDAEGNPLTELDLSENTVLKNVSLCYCQLKSVDVTGLELLKNLDVSYNRLKALDLQTNTALQSLDCSGNGLTALDVSACTELTSLLCSENSIAVLDVSALTGLKGLYCNDNELSTLDLHANPLLEELDCSSNHLTSIDLRANTLLRVLWTIGNGMTALDVSMLPELRVLECYDMPLETLNLGKLQNLWRLACYEMPADFLLDFTGCPILVDVYKNGTRRPLYSGTELLFVEYKSAPLGGILELDENPLVLGDLNGDGILSALDLMHLRKLLVDLPVEDLIPAAADLNRDGVMDILDLVRLRKLLAD